MLIFTYVFLFSILLHIFNITFIKLLFFSGQNNLTEVSADAFPRLVRMCFSINFPGDGATETLTRSSPTLGEAWVRDLWNLARELQVNMASSLPDVPLVPEYNTKSITLHCLTKHFIAKSYHGFDDLPEDICRCVQKLGGVVLSHVPDYIQAVFPLGACEMIQFPSPQGVLHLIGHASRKNIGEFNSMTKTSIKTSLVKYLASCTNIALEVKMVLKQLKLFVNTASSKRNISVADLNKIAPADDIPVAYPSVYLSGKSMVACVLAKHIGAEEFSMNQIISKILDIMASAYQTQYNIDDIQRFMAFLFEKSQLYFTNSKVKQKAVEICFVPSGNVGKLFRAKDLFDPDCSFLKELFHGEDKFPDVKFCQTVSVSDLRVLGLKGKYNVSVDDICCSVSITESIFNTFANPERIIQKGIGILTALERCNMTNTQIINLFNYRWMPVLMHRPSSYPEHLGFVGDTECVIARPQDMCDSIHLSLVGSVRAVTMSPLPDKIAPFCYSPTEEMVLAHLKNIIDTYTADEHQKYLAQLEEVYRYFSTICLSQKSLIMLADTKTVWVGENGEFVQADKIWIKHLSSDVDLSPYRYPILKSLKSFSHFFQQIGASQDQTPQMLMDVLCEIQHKHGSPSDQATVMKDHSLVRNIINILKEDSSVNKKLILIPVHSCEEYLVLKTVENCVYCESYLQTEDETDENEQCNFADISSEQASGLGVRILSNPLLESTDEIDMNYGQKEPLTRRLRNLLREYTDGFSVPKEIIQNADDAGASVVNFLYDERENLDAQSNLINKGMASVQGPALWAQNDALFSESDFTNITKLSGETKMDDSTKIGRFGLGFNAIYNLTDVPSFISGNNIVIFDPHKSYLGSPGIKADLTKQKNKTMLHKMKDQFKPFQGVFGCDLRQHNSQTTYDGTLFRFPLRTEEQAQQSEISELYYSPSEMKMFLDIFLEGAGNLLLFCQSVKTIRMYHLPKHMSDASKATLLVEVKKNTDQVSRQIPETVLKLFSVIWNERCENKHFETTDFINETITICLKVFNSTNNVCSITPTVNKVRWAIAWVLGTKESAQMAMMKKVKGLLPIAAAAVPVGDSQCHSYLLPLQHCPLGFYKQGHLFCFLPLPIKIPLPMHINGSFAVTHDRKQLCSKSEGEKSLSVEAKWNEVLNSDAVPLSVIKVLEALKTIGDIDPERFYSLWPGSELQYGTLVKQFHEIIVYENPEVLLYNGRWVGFQETMFLDPLLRFTKHVGQIAFKAFEYFNKGQRMVVDLPEKIFKGFAAAGLNTELKKHTMNMNDFYEGIFFPNINDTYWKKEERDSLVVFALEQGNAKFRDLLKEVPCIPTRPSGTLRRPQDLVHPHGKTAKLFRDTDGVFPLNSKENNFCTEKLLSILSELGMQNNNLHWSVLYERVTSVATLYEENVEDSIRRCKYILYYLEESQIIQGEQCQRNRFMTCPNELREQMQNERFLPILQKPPNWPSVWCCTDENRQLARPCSLCFNHCMYIASSNTLVLDSTSLDWATTRNVLQWLGVQSDVPVQNVIDHLVSVALTEIAMLDTLAYHKLSSMCSSIYLHLNKVCSSENDSLVELVHEKLQGKTVILQDKTFIKPEQMAFSLEYELKPYLYKVQSWLQKSSFLRTIGVREMFEPKDAADIMKQMADSCEANELSETHLQCYSSAASLLVKLVDNKEPGSVGMQFQSLYLPDKRAVLHPFSELCLDDCDWLSERGCMTFLHHRMTVEVAVAFGVKTKRQADLKSHAVPFIKSFGQHERLTNRLRRILEGYPHDASLMKELLQNADDAGASELMFIKDFRAHPCEKLFDDRWKPLQGPALCVYNDSYFTQKDLDGIQNLGIGSKAEDPLKTGQYGVGFNAVYHLTDVPTFLSVGPQIGETLCVLDPNCRYTPTAEPGVPGARFDNLSELRSSYKDVFSCYLEDVVKLHPQGTLFRFPLRTKEMAERSDISQNAVCEKDIEKMINSFTSEMTESLLFLHNVRKISVASIDGNGCIKIEHAVKASVCADDTQKQNQFLDSLGQQMQTARTQNTSLKEMSAEQILVKMKVKNCDKHEEEEWLVIHQFGFSSNYDLPNEIDLAWKKGEIKLLPRGGVAARLDKPNAQNDKKAFCMLPLPIKTGLPVHINGHFALDHEARRNLWHGTSDIRSLWNKQIVEALIVPAYLAALRHLQVFEAVNINKVQRSVDSYNTLFPDGEKTTDEVWKSLAYAFYRTVYHDKLTVFPVINGHKNSDLLSWVSVHVNEGFPGYFNDLKTYFTDDSIYRSQGNVVSSASHKTFTKTTGTTSSSLNAHELTALLKRIGMKVIEAPVWIYRNFDLVDLGKVVHRVTPDNVITFMQSWNSHDGTDKCVVGELPLLVSRSPFCDTATVQFLISFCQKSDTFHENIVGLPLCLTNSSMLTYFSSKIPMFVTNFTGLIQGSSDKCLHRDIVDLFLEHTQSPALKELHIGDLCHLLDKTLNAAVFKQGKPVDWSKTEQNPTKTWLKTFWTFLSIDLQETFTKKRLSVSDFQQLKEWSLLPCSVIKNENCIRSSESLNQLYPIEKATLVVNLEIETSKEMISALKTLGLPCLNSDPLVYTEKVRKFASLITADLTNPKQMLLALTNHKYDKTLSRNIACTILKYFCDSLDDMQPIRDVELNMLKTLPCFITLSGSTLSLVNCSSPVFVIDIYQPIPQKGLDVWSSAVCKSLFQYRYELKKLYSFMNLTSVNPEDFYSQYLLPNFMFLPKEAKAVHLKHIKDKLLTCGFDQKWSTEQTTLREALKTVPFIEKTDGTLCRASEFFSNKEIVFRVMCPPTKFPPPPYDSPEWHGFLVLAGMINKVSVNQFVIFANEVQTLGKTDITEEIAKKSNTLVNHLLDRPNLLKENLLSQIKHIKFVLPFSVRNHHKHGEILDSIYQQYENGSQLVAFSGSLTSKNCYLVWSSCNLLSHLPYCDKKILSQLGSKFTPQKDDVLVHMKNISKSLKQMKVPAIRKIQTCLEEIMHSCYEYFGKEGVTEADREYLQPYPVIYLNEKGRMVKACDIILNLAQEDAIPGYIFFAPVYFGHYFNIFEKLGASKTASANHYANVLYQKHAETGDNKLIPNDWTVVQKAVDMLFTCFINKRYSKELSVSSLYLPSTMQTLVCSKDLVLSNSYVLQKRIQALSLPYFIGFDVLKIKVFDYEGTINLLPEKYRPRILTSLVEEHVTANCQQQAYTGTHSDMYQQHIRSTAFVSGIIRLVMHQTKLNDNSSLTEEKVKLIQQMFLNLQIREINDLTTNLLYCRSPVAGSESKRKCFLEFQPQKDETILFVDTHACQAKLSMCQVIAERIDKMVRGKIGNKIVIVSNMLQMDESDIGSYLDGSEILKSNFQIGESEVCLYPPPGTLIPEEFHWMLDTNFESLDVGEYIGLEVFDPVVIQRDEDAASVSLDSASDSSMESSDAVYIYAIVKDISDQNDCPMMSKYQVEVGDGRIEELNATKLYKFCRKIKVSSKEVVLSSTPASSPSLNEVLREIRQTLKNAWLHFDEQDRRRVVMRLYLKWHPDKNDPDRKQLCTSVCQYIQHCVDKLKRGESIDEVDERHSWSSPSTFEQSWFFNHMNRRSQSQSSYYHGYQEQSRQRTRHGSYSRFHTNDFHSATRERPYPHRQEARRWLRQAAVDLAAAENALSQTAYDAFNWICFKSHQVHHASCSICFKSHQVHHASCSICVFDRQM